MTDAPLADTVVIVTGGGRGLGRAMTLGLVGAGAHVVAAMHIAGDLDRIAAEAAALPGGGKLHAMLADVRHVDDCADVVKAAIEHFGGLHVLVNNAGVGMLLISDSYTSEPTRFWQAPVDAVRTVIETNFFAPFLMAREAMPHMLDQGWGRIVNVTTSIHTMQRRGYFPYGPAKAGFEAASLVWAGDVEGTGVTVNILIPGGATDTNILPGELGDKTRSGADGKLLEPDVMAAPILWLASTASDGVNGMRIIADRWDTALDADAAAKAAMAPAGFEPRTAG
jgi:3-oxoacyl-[acyl-carrier protein] reductase